jgi:hypothetical protein
VGLDQRIARVPILRRDGTCVAWALLDAADRANFGRHAWRLGSNGYAVRSETTGGTKRTIYLHREVAGTPPGVLTDHVNGNRLDNRRANLRVATRGENNANSRDRPRRSGFRGVYWHRQAGRWVSQISVDGRLRHLGLFDDPEDAAMAYDLAAREAWGPYARTNSLA